MFINLINRFHIYYKIIVIYIFHKFLSICVGLIFIEIPNKSYDKSYHASASVFDTKLIIYPLIALMNLYDEYSTIPVVSPIGISNWSLKYETILEN